MGVSIDGFDELMAQLSNPQELASKMINDNGGMEIECPNCHNVVFVPTTGTTCSCGNEITVTFEN